LRALLPEEQAVTDGMVAASLMLAHEVTNRQFREFVEETGYITEAEFGINENQATSGSALFTNSTHEEGGNWELSRSATWKTPEGAGSSLRGKDYYPVVHVSQNDARAFAAWSGGRLPTETEWEYAATLGLPDKMSQTSGAYSAQGEPRANTWQGLFPLLDSGTDGFKGIAPIACFASDRLGLYDMIGNVWEWTSTEYSANQHTIKGGSFLCAENYCRRYRPIARQAQESDFSTNHIGFRIVKDPVD
jgi:formylglycine-generating enzyme required for sulfatase activity